MALISTINSLETVSVPLASSLVETHKGEGVQNNASDKTEATIQWCCLEQRCPCLCLNVILGKDHPTLSQLHVQFMVQKTAVVQVLSFQIANQCSGAATSIVKVL